MNMNDDDLARIWILSKLMDQWTSGQFSLNLGGEMKSGFFLVAFLYCSGQAFWLDLDLELDTALSRSKRSSTRPETPGSIFATPFGKRF